MIIAGVNLSHDASLCVLDDGKLVHYQEAERLCHDKHTFSWYYFISDIVDKYQPHQIFISYFSQSVLEFDIPAIKSILHKYNRPNGVKSFKSYNTDEHHTWHATNAFYNSGFDDACCVVIDGAGKHYRETNPDGSKGQVLRQQASILTFSKGEDPVLHRMRLNKQTELYKGIGTLWEYVSERFYGKSDWHGAGKLMGASAYGKDDPSHPRAYDENGDGNKHFLAALSPSKNVMSFEDACYRLQQDSFDALCKIIDEAIELTGKNKIACSGGFFMNVVNNYKLLKKYPNIEFYIDPICTDNGTAIGVARYYWYNQNPTDEIKPIETLYLGTQADYDRDLQEGETEYPITPKEVAQLIADRNIVALYQGRAEAGPRALGNRSLLYDPRDPNGRDVVNTIKKREWYRPFAGTVMEEHCHEYFDMAGLKNSPFMMYAVECYEDKRDLVPALQHNDGTSRIQTLTHKQNPHYYDLINEFYQLTGIPMVLNTSFNEAGDTLVDNMKDAQRTCRNCGIRYLYCPERNLMIDFQGDK